MERCGLRRGVSPKVRPLEERCSFQEEVVMYSLRILVNIKDVTARTRHGHHQKQKKCQVSARDVVPPGFRSASSLFLRTNIRKDQKVN